MQDCVRGPQPCGRPPAVKHMDLILRKLNDQRNAPMLIHCDAAMGRAGTVAACYVVVQIFGPPSAARRI